MTKRKDIHNLCFNKFNKKFVKLISGRDYFDFAFDLFVENKRLKKILNDTHKYIVADLERYTDGELGSEEFMEGRALDAKNINKILKERVR